MLGRYAVPIVISDSGKPKSQSATSTLTVIIGDRNDNPMFDGQSSILVYNYKGPLPAEFTEFYRVFPVFVVFDRVSNGISQDSMCLKGFTGFYRIFPVFVLLERVSDRIF